MVLRESNPTGKAALQRIEQCRCLAGFSDGATSLNVDDSTWCCSQPTSLAGLWCLMSPLLFPLGSGDDE